MSHAPITSQRASRKDEHLELAMRLHSQDRAGAFDDVSFIHHSLPGVSAEQVDIGTTVLGSRWESPFYINAMTGGTQATAAINANLAEATAGWEVVVAEERWRQVTGPDGREGRRADAVVCLRRPEFPAS